MKSFVIGLLATLILAIPAIADSAPCGWEYVHADGWFYYSSPPGDTMNNNRALYRYRPDTGAREVLAEGRPFNWLCVADGWVYSPAQNTDFGDDTVQRVRIDGSATEQFCQGVNLIEVFAVDGAVYITRADPRAKSVMLDRYDPATKALLGSVVLTTQSETAGYGADGFVFDGEYVYYAVTDGALGTEYRNEGHRFMRAKLDGTAGEEWFVPNTPLAVTTWTVWGGRLYYSLVDRKTGRCALRSVGLDGTGDSVVFEEAVYGWFCDGGWMYGAPLEWDAEFESYDWSDSQTVRMELATGRTENVGEYCVSAFEPAGDYLIYSNVDNDTRTAPLIISADGRPIGPLLGE